MGGRQAVRPRTLDPVSKVRILPAQPVSWGLSWRHFQNFVVSRGAVPSRTALVVFTKLTGPIGASGKPFHRPALKRGRLLKKI